MDHCNLHSPVERAHGSLHGDHLDHHVEHRHLEKIAAEAVAGIRTAVVVAGNLKGVLQAEEVEEDNCIVEVPPYSFGGSSGQSLKRGSGFLEAAAGGRPAAAADEAGSSAAVGAEWLLALGIEMMSAGLGRTDSRLALELARTPAAVDEEPAAAGRMHPGCSACRGERSLAVGNEC